MCYVSWTVVHFINVHLSSFFFYSEDNEDRSDNYSIESSDDENDGNLWNDGDDLGDVSFDGEVIPEEHCLDDEYSDMSDIEVRLCGIKCRLVVFVRHARWIRISPSYILCRI